MKSPMYSLSRVRDGILLRTPRETTVESLQGTTEFTAQRMSKGNWKKLSKELLRDLPNN